MELWRSLDAKMLIKAAEKEQIVSFKKGTLLASFNISLLLHFNEALYA